MTYVQRRRPGQHRYCHQGLYHLVSLCFIIVGQVLEFFYFRDNGYTISKSVKRKIY